MNEKLRRGVESCPSVEFKEVKESKLLGFINKHKNKIASVLGGMVFLGGINNAKADTGTVDDIVFDRNLTSSGGAALMLDMKNGQYTLEETFSNGGEVELNVSHSARIKSGSNLKGVEFLNNSGTVVETHFFNENIFSSNPIVSLGQDYYLLKTTGNTYIFNSNEIGSQSGVSFRVSSKNTASGLVTHLNKHPQTNDIVGVTLSGDFNNPAFFFSYALGDFTSTHPIAGSEVLVDEALSNVGMLGQSGPKASSVMPNGDIVFAYTDDNGVTQQWINPESDEVVAPTPVISAPAEFTMNVADMIAGKKLEINVKDVPANGSVVLELAGEVFEMSSVGNGDYELVFVEQDLKNIQGGEFDEVVVVKVLDESGAEVATASLDASVDIVNPNAIEFGIDGAEIQTIGGVDVHIIESEEIPAVIRFTWIDGAFDQIENSELVVNSDFNDQVTTIQIIDFQTLFTTMNLKEGVSNVSFNVYDQAGNVLASEFKIDVKKIADVVMENCETNSEGEDCEKPVETCETNRDLAGCEAPVVEPEPEPTPGPGVDGGNDGDDGSGGEGCATPGQDGSPSAPLSVLIAGVAAVGLRRRKRKIPKSSK